MWPFSSGSRSASRALRANSGNSSKNSTPWWASDMAPGRGGEPPPTSATALAVWCGALVGRRPHSCGSKRPARLATAALSSASCSVMAGSRLLKRWASMDLPAPGGPTSSRPCPPAAAISRARLACTWPFTSARSGPLARWTGACAVMRCQPSPPGWPSKCATTSSKCAAPNTWAAGAKAASRALSRGKTRR